MLGIFEVVYSKAKEETDSFEPVTVRWFQLEMLRFWKHFQSVHFSFLDKMGRGIQPDDGEMEHQKVEVQIAGLLAEWWSINKVQNAFPWRDPMISPF